MDKFERGKFNNLVQLLTQCQDLASILIGYDVGKSAANALVKQNLTVVGDKKSNIIPFPTATNKDIENSKAKNKNSVSEAKSITEEDFDLTYGKGSIILRRRIMNEKVYEFYVGRFYFKGKQYEVSAATKAECYEKMRTKKIDLLTGTPSKPAKKSLMLNDWLLQWFDLYKKDQTNAKMLSFYIKRINTFFGNIQLKNVTSEQLQKFINTFAEIPNTQKKIYDLLNGSFKKAVAFRHLKNNPMEAVERKRFKCKKKRAFEFSEQEKLLAALPCKYAAAFFILCSTGLRIGEYLALSQADFNFERMSIRVNKEIDTATMKPKERVKSDSSDREIPFTSQLLEIADKLDPAREYFSITYYGIKKALVRAMQVLSIDSEYLSLHSTRHTFMSVCDFIGFRDKLIQAWAGHSTIAMTKDTYTHLLNKGNSLILDYLKGLKKATE